MRLRTRHLAGATSLFCLLLLTPPSLPAQEGMTYPAEAANCPVDEMTYPSEEVGCPDEGMCCPSDGACAPNGYSDAMMGGCPSCKPPLGARLHAGIRNCIAGCCQKFRTAGQGCYAYRPYTESSQPDLFYNFYVPNPRGAGGAAYPAPYPTPSLVGHTYYTYQPLMPHEFLYKHHRTYHQYYNQGMGMNRTSVRWYGTPLLTTAQGVRQFFTLPR